ncbi:PREDICTED: myosin-10-like [Branchiostoma belcheri]|uniref:Myosin-10-like n=1 Tax=Branchiostoma belcheri TaxID=7741 RepID=A0A6P4YVX0_BRABE|nr:PREDICTED: myosin-10-like [Branchiostoma belcheri]
MLSLRIIQHLEKTLQDRVSLKDREVSELKARMTDLQSEKTQESTEAAAKIRELEVRLVDQAANTRHRISQKDQEIESLTARVAELEAEKKGFDKARPNMLSQTLQAKNVLIDPRPILQEIQKIRKSNDERMAHQQEMVRKLRKQVEANKGFVKQLKQDLTEQIEPHGKVLKDTLDKNHKEAVQKAAEVPQILLNGVPLLDAKEQEEEHQKVAEVPQILLNGVPLLDADEHEEAAQKAAEVPQILLNGVPLLDAEEHEEAAQKAAEVPQILLNGVPLLDAEEQEEAAQKAAEVPQILINGVPLLDAEEQEEAAQKAAEVPQILINGVPLLDAEEQEEAVQKAAEVPQILLNGMPLLDAEEHEEAVQKAAEVPRILINGVPLLDAEEHEEAVQKAAEVPQILINGVPLLDAEEQEEADQKAAEVPQILLNGVPLLDAEELDKVEKKAASMPQQFLSGFSLPNDGNSERSDIPHCIPESPTNESEKEEDTFGMGLASQQNTSLSAGDASIETTLTTVQQPLRIPEFFVVHNFPRSLVAHRLPPNCTMDPVPLQVHFVPNDGCASGEIYYDLDSWADAFEAAMDAMDSGLGDFHCASPYPARKSASFPAQACSTHVLDDWLKPFDPRQRDSIISRASLKDLPTKSEVGSGDMKPQSPGAPSSWWKPEKPTKYQEFGEPSMSLLDFTAADEPRGLEVLIEKKAPSQFWCAPPALVRGDESRGLELVLEGSNDSQAVQQKALQRYELTKMAAVSGQEMSHSTISMQVNTSPATEGEDTVRDDPVTFEPCFLLALLTHRIKRGYRLSTVLY